MKHYILKFEEVVKACWDGKALCNYGGEEFTYASLATSIEKLHIFFEKSGIVKGDRVSICARNSARWGIAFLASNTYGTVTVPLLADFTPESVGNLVEHSGSRVLFVDPDIWKKMDHTGTHGLDIVLNIKDFSLLYASSEAVSKAFEGINAAFELKYPMGFSRESVSYPAGASDELALINYTSGTTSSPKGVMLSYGNLSVTVEFSQNYVHSVPGESVVSILPLAHMYGLAIEFLFPVCSGSCIHFLGKTPSPTLLARAMKESSPYMFICVPLIMEKVYKSAVKPLLDRWYMRILIHTPIASSLIYKKIGKKFSEFFGGKVRIYIMGGAPLNPEVEKFLRKIKLPFTVGYGMTEAAPLLTFSSPETFVHGSCGRPCHEIVIDSDDPHRIAGEILTKGPNIFMGYYENPEANAAAFDQDGYFRTGDIGIMDKNGNVFIKGRSKSMILGSNGQNIYPEELEAVVNSQPYVNESVVLDRAGKIVALVYLDKDAIRRDKLDEETVADIPERVLVNSNRELPAYSRIARVEVVLVPFEKTPKMSIKRFLYK